MRVATDNVDLLVRRSFTKAKAPDGTDICDVLCTDPQPLTSKSSWCDFAAMVDFFPMIRTLGHTGIVVQHGCFDRLHQSSMSKMMQQRTELYYEVVGGKGPREGPIALQELLDWVVSTGCVAHDIHNALKWGLEIVVDDVKDVLDRLYITVESLRNAYDLVHGYLMIFIKQYLTADPHPHSFADVLEFWVCLGVEPDVAHSLAVMNLRWEDGALKVSAESTEREGLLGSVFSCMLHLFRFIKFTSGRWATIAASSKTLVASVAIGVRPLVALIRASPKTSDYYMHGFSQLNDTALTYAIVSAMAGRVVDVPLLKMLKDDRLALSVHGIEACIVEQQSWLAKDRPLTWQRLAALVADGDAQHLRSECISAGCTAAAFLHMRALRVAKAYPWKLCHGDINANLDELCAFEECPSDDTTTRKYINSCAWATTREI